MVSLAAMACPEHERPSVELKLVSSSNLYSKPGEFALRFSIQNRESEPLLVLPNQVRRDYEARSGGQVKYLPFPGPALSPWMNAFVLQPGEVRTLEQSGMRDGDGSWDLSAGQYRLRLRYEVGREFETSAGSRPDALVGSKLWTGVVSSNPVTVEYQP